MINVETISGCHASSPPPNFTPGWHSPQPKLPWTSSHSPLASTLPGILFLGSFHLIFLLLAFTRSSQRCGECEESIFGSDKEGGRGGTSGREECEKDRLLLCKQRAHGQLVEEGQGRDGRGQQFKNGEKGLKCPFITVPINNYCVTSFSIIQVCGWFTGTFDMMRSSFSLDNFDNVDHVDNVDNDDNVKNVDNVDTVY